MRRNVPAQQLSANPPPLRQDKNMQILLVEDEKRLSKALKQILEEKKYMVDAVYDGEDGLSYAL